MQRSHSIFLGFALIISACILTLKPSVSRADDPPCGITACDLPQPEFTLVAHTTLTTSASTITVDSIPYRARYKIIVMSPSVEWGEQTPTLYFNGDNSTDEETGFNYGRSVTGWASAVFLSGMDRTAEMNVAVEVTNVSSLFKTLNGRVTYTTDSDAPGGNPPVATDLTYAWQNVEDPISRVDVSAYSFAVGSYVAVYGSNF